MGTIPKVPNTALIREPRPWERPRLPKTDLGVPTKDLSQKPVKPKESKMEDLQTPGRAMTAIELEHQQKLEYQKLVIAELKESQMKQLLTQQESELKSLREEIATYLFVFKMFRGIVASVLKRYDREEEE